MLTPYHFGEVANDLLIKLGMKPLFNRDVGTVDRAGPPITFVGKSQGAAKEDPVARAAGRRIAVVHGEPRNSFTTPCMRRATDIHLEPTPEQLSVRYRIDGILHAAEPFDRPTGDAVINVFKVLSAMDISEKRKPQDGSFGAKLVGPRPRFPRRHLGLEGRREDGHANPRQQLGRRQARRPGHADQADRPDPRPGHPAARHVSRLRADRRRQVDHALRLPSAKSTGTRRTSSPSRTRSSTTSTTSPRWRSTPSSGQTFATSLRSILRQDPDVIMIGEIRDNETATIACQAANTGHMVFSTVHSNDAVDGAVPAARPRRRAVHDRLGPVRRARPAARAHPLRACKEPYKPKPEFLKKANLPVEKVDVFYRRPENPEQVCQQCGGTGYFGRTGIYELLVITEAMRDMIRENPSINKIKAEARKNGMIYLQEDGLRQVIQGRTSIEELLRVVK